MISEIISVSSGEMPEARGATEDRSGTGTHTLLLDHFVSLMVKTVVRAVLMRPSGRGPGSPLRSTYMLASSVDVSRT